LPTDGDLPLVDPGQTGPILLGGGDNGLTNGGSGGGGGGGAGGGGTGGGAGGGMGGGGTDPTTGDPSTSPTTPTVPGTPTLPTIEPPVPPTDKPTVPTIPTFDTPTGGGGTGGGGPPPIVIEPGPPTIGPADPVPGAPTPSDPPASGGGTLLPGAVPEPGTWGLMILGFGAVGYILRRRRAAGNLRLLALLFTHPIERRQAAGGERRGALLYCRHLRGQAGERVIDGGLAQARKALLRCGELAIQRLESVV